MYAIIIIDKLNIFKITKCYAFYKNYSFAYSEIIHNNSIIYIFRIWDFRYSIEVLKAILKRILSKSRYATLVGIHPSMPRSI